MDQSQIHEASALKHEDADIKPLHSLNIPIHRGIPGTKFDLEVFIRRVAQKIAVRSHADKGPSIEHRIQKVIALLELQKSCSLDYHTVRDRPKILSCPHDSSNCICYETENSKFQGWYCAVPCNQIKYFGERSNFEAEHKEVITTAKEAKERLELFLIGKYPRSALVKSVFSRQDWSRVDTPYQKVEDFSARGSGVHSMSSSSGTPESWISSFCSLLGHEYFAEISEDFIEDDFNLTGLQTQVAMYKEALEMILDVEPEEDEDDDEDEEEEEGDESIEGEERSARRGAAERRHHRMASDLSIIESSAEMLYGLIHQRFICSRAGIQQMSEKYELAHFGVCPRTYCEGVRTLPVGLSDVPGEDTVKLFCPSCLDVYVPPNSRFQTVDGAFFGRTFGALFLLTFPDYDISKKGADTLAGAHGPRSLPASHTTDGEDKEKINGMNACNLAPGLGRGKVYEPKIYGFKVSERARSGPRMGWLRKRPVDINDLDEAALYQNEHPDESDEADVNGGNHSQPRQPTSARKQRRTNGGSPMSIEANGDSAFA